MSIHETIRPAGHERPTQARCLDEAIERAGQHLGAHPTLTSIEIVDSYHTDINDEYPFVTRQLTAYTTDEVVETETLSGRDFAGNPFAVNLFTKKHHGSEINDIDFSLDGYNRDTRRPEYRTFAYTKLGESVDVYVSPIAELKRQLRAILRRK